LRRAGRLAARRSVKFMFHWSHRGRPEPPVAEARLEPFAAANRPCNATATCDTYSL
jgi:hypothetical protein